MRNNKKINDYDRATRALMMCLGGLIGTATLSAAVLNAIKVSADGEPTTTVSANASVTVPATCTMGGDGMSSHTATISPGTWSGASGSEYEQGIGKTTLTVFCNDFEGFAIYAIGYTGDVAGQNTLVGGGASTPTIATGTATSGGTSNWSMKVDKVTDSTAYMPSYMNIDNGYSAWSAVPSNYAKVAHFAATTTGQSSATDTEKGAKVATTYAVYASSSQAADTYTGQVKYVMVHPNSFVAGTYTIAYNANGGTGTMTSETGVLNYEEHTLKANTFTGSSGKDFAGWCTTNTSQSECAGGTSYADGDTVPPSTVAPGSTLNLYAIWEEPPYMQDQTSATMAALLPNVGDTTTLYDKRDVQPYTVAKLADGKYWMVENLNLAGGTALSADDTDVTSAYISSFSTSNNLTKTGDTIVLPASSKSGFNTDNYSYVYNSGKKTNCGALDQNTPCYSYYSWDAATLGSGRTIATDNENAPYSICPKGWKLPSTYNGTNSTTDFRALMIALGGSASVQTYNSSTTPTGATMSTALRSSPYSFLLAGQYSQGFLNSGGYTGLYWSSTSGSNTNVARSLSFNSSDAYSATSGSRSGGCSVRCLLGS